MNKILPIILLLLLPFMGSAQDQNVALNHKTTTKNSFSLQTGTFHYFGVLRQSGGPFNYLGANYNRLLNKRLSTYIQVTYQLGENVEPENDRSKVFEYENYRYQENKIRRSGKNYSFWDLGIAYNFFNYKKVSLEAIASISIGNGRKGYDEPIQKRYIFQNQYVYYDTYEEKFIRETIFGGTLGLAAHYSFMDDRFTVGSSITARRYFAQYFPFQLNFGVHIGVLF